MNRSHKRAESAAPERPITFRAAEDLGAFELAQLWADCTAWNLNERTAYDELAELACMSALARWLARWQPIAIHSAVLAGAQMEAIAGALGGSLQVAFDRWHEWALRQCEFIIGGKPGITENEYQTVVQRFAAMGVGKALHSTGVTTSLPNLCFARGTGARHESRGRDCGEPWRGSIQGGQG